MATIRGRTPSWPGAGLTLACAAAVWLLAAGESSAQTAPAVGGTILEIHGTRRVERGPAAATSAPESKDASLNALFPRLAPSVPSPAVDGPITVGPAFSTKI